MSKHTPGPYKAVHTHGLFPSISFPPLAREKERILTIAYPCKNLQEADATADLLAAAPDLLQMVLWLSAELNQTYPMHVLCQQAEKLISKVEGKGDK